MTESRVKFKMQIKAEFKSTVKKQHFTDARPFNFMYSYVVSYFKLIFFCVAILQKTNHHFLTNRLLRLLFVNICNIT